MIEIDGSRGEGGGQTLRNSVALSCITGRIIKIRNIRAGRKKPGLRAQHLAVVKTLSDMCGAEVSGCEPNSTEIVFRPGRGGQSKITANIGTAGSIPLVLQAVIPAAALSHRAVRLDIVGGTDVPYSPTLDYVRLVWREACCRFGISFDVEVARRGYYPAGGGRATASVRPCMRARPVCLTGQTKGERQMVCARSNTNWELPPPAKTSDWPADGVGGSALLYSWDENHIVGVDMLMGGRIDYLHGRYAASGSVDDNLADMLVLPASVTDGTSVFRVSSITKHLETALYVASRITGCRYGVGRIKTGYEVRISPTGPCQAPPQETVPPRTVPRKPPLV